jgi:(S)-3,5-dihydroxyphenylglycine transaminase
MCPFGITMGTGCTRLPFTSAIWARAAQRVMQRGSLRGVAVGGPRAVGIPGAVSFASGRPTEEFFDVGLLHEYIDGYCRYLHGTRGFSKEQVSQALFQYGRTKGIINELIARQLAADEGIEVDPEALVVTVGCQEAMFIVIRALRADERDVLLAVSPTYVGLTGAARLADMPVWPVRSGPAGIDFADLTAQVRRARDAGLRPRGLLRDARLRQPVGGQPAGPVAAPPAGTGRARAAPAPGGQPLRHLP